MSASDRRIAALAAEQSGAFSRLQANDAGLSDHQLRRRVANGVIEQVGPNAFRFPGAPVTLRSQLGDLVLDIGEPVWCCGPTAGALHGFDGLVLRKPFHLLVPRTRHVERSSVRLHRSGAIDLVDHTVVDGLPVTTAARTLIDLARLMSAERLAACVDSAIRDGLVSEDALHRQIVRLRSQGRFGLPLLHEVLAGFEVTRGGHSWLEREYLRVINAAGIPRPDTQQILNRRRDRLIRVDCRFPGTKVVVELLGYRFHRTRAQMTTDAARYNALLADGFLPYQFTYGQVVEDAAHVVQVTRAALATHRGAAS